MYYRITISLYIYFVNYIINVSFCRLKKIEKKMKKKKVTELTTKLQDKKAKKLYTTICDDNDKYLNNGKTGSTELNKSLLFLLL